MIFAMRNLRILYATAFLLCPLTFASQGPEPGQDGGPPAEEAAPRGLITKTDAACEGYTLFSPLRSQTSLLINLDGEVVHEWTTDCSPGNSAYLQDNGDLIRCGRVSNEVFKGGGQGGKIQRLDWDGNLLWDLPLSDDKMLAHHDIAIMPNGNILVIAWEYKSPGAAKGAGRVESQISSKGFWPDMVLEYAIDEAGAATVVWEWHAFHHTIQDTSEDFAHFGVVADHPELIDINGDLRADPARTEAQEKRNKEAAERRKKELEERMRALGYTGDDEEEEDDEEDSGPSSGDWMHTNGIDYDPVHDLILLSVRTFSEVWVIDHSTTTAEAKGHTGGRFGHGGDLLYRLGNPQANGTGTSADQRLFKQHDARWLGAVEGGLGILVFNNGEGRPDGAYSSVDEIVLPFDAKEGFGSERAKLAWQYKAAEPESFFASFVSGSQRLPNGNTLVCHGVLGQLIEVNRAGETVWEYHNPREGDQPLDAGGPRRRGRQGGPPPQDRRGPPPGDPGGGPPHEGGPPHDGPPGGPGGRGPRGGRGGRGGMLKYGMFRGTRISAEHPGLAGREL